MKARALLFTVVALCASGASKPDNVPASIWVREDLFAGYLHGDMETFARGERKVDELLATNPKSPGLRAWKSSAQYFRAIRAYEGGDTASSDRAYKEVVDTFESLVQQAPKDVGVLAIYGGSISTLGHRCRRNCRRPRISGPRRCLSNSRSYRKHSSKRCLSITVVKCSQEWLKAQLVPGKTNWRGPN